MLSEAGKHYGENIYNIYSIKLTKELGKEYSASSLRRFKQFYIVFKKCATVSRNLSWSHYQELIPLKDINKINYYVYICQTNNLSVHELRKRIKSNEYERLGEEARIKLVNNADNELTVTSLIKNPILIKNTTDIDNNKITHSLLEKLILEDIESFMKELGDGFSFIGSEYKIKVNESINNYIDLLLFNIKYNCYVVIELKTTLLTKQDIGQLQIYMNYINTNFKTINQDNTIGIIICKENNEYVIKYCSDNRIISKEYKLIK